MRLWGIFLAFLWLAAMATSASATVSANSIVTTQTPKAYKAQILPADTTTAKTLAAGGSNGTKVVSVICTNTDTAAAYAITLSVLRSATTYVLGTVNVPLSSGNTTAAPSVNMLNSSSIPGLPTDSDGNPYVFLESSDTLQINSGTTVNTAKVVSCSTVAADF